MTTTTITTTDRIAGVIKYLADPKESGWTNVAHVIEALQDIPEAEIMDLVNRQNLREREREIYGRRQMVTLVRMRG